MNTHDTPRNRGGSWGSRSWALLLVLGGLLASATAAFAFWTVSVIYAPTNYSLADAATLSAPTAPTATVNGSAAITVGWTLPVTQLTGTHYQVTRTSGPGSLFTVCTVASSATSCQDSGLTGGTTYGYSVVAVLGSDWQSAAITTSATTNKASQTISFTSTAPAAAVVGGATYTPTATATSGLTVAFTIDGSSSSVCNISGGAVSFTAVGTCVIDANQAGNANYLAAPQVQQSFAVGKGSQTITFTSTAPAGAVVGGATYTVTATGGASGNAVTFAIDSSATSFCSISGSSVSFIGAGTCVIDANQAGNGNYNAAPQAQQSFAVGKGSQTITFTSTAPAGAAVGGATYTPGATATSGLAVTFTIDASSSSVCSISGGAVSFTAVGTCTIDANQAGNANWIAAPQKQQSFTVAKGSQTITFTSTAPAGAAVGGATYTVNATGGGSGNAVTFTIDSSATSVCSISGSTVSFIAVGTCVIDANQAGNLDWNAAPQAQQSFAVAKGSQTITITSTAPSGAVVGGATYTVTDTGGGSGNAVTLTIDSSTTSHCSISGSTVSFTAVGTCTIDANQAGNANYNAAPQAQQSFAVGKGSQTITFTSTAPSSATVGGATYTVTATGGASGNAVTFTIDSSATSVCSISGSTVSFTAAGTCVIDANQAGNTNYNAAPQAQQSFVVATPALSFTHSNFDCSSGSIHLTSGTWTANVSRSGSTAAQVTVTVSPVASGGSLTIAAGASESSGQFTVNRPGSNSGVVVTASAPGYTSVSCTVFKN